MSFTRFQKTAFAVLCATCAGGSVVASTSDTVNSLPKCLKCLFESCCSLHKITEQLVGKKSSKICQALKESDDFDEASKDFWTFYGFNTNRYVSEFIKQRCAAIYFLEVLVHVKGEIQLLQESIKDLSPGLVEDNGGENPREDSPLPIEPYWIVKDLKEATEVIIGCMSYPSFDKKGMGISVTTIPSYSSAAESYLDILGQDEPTSDEHTTAKEFCTIILKNKYSKWM